MKNVNCMKLDFLASLKAFVFIINNCFALIIGLIEKHANILKITMMNIQLIIKGPLLKIIFAMIATILFVDLYQGLS
ncbi:hypothetical protein BJ944DRAFT_273319 [Cunninghamella echinulata]|nr:hypothetical protein BJ944DRAFT_273319 [Cunninghamella echinulata]